MEYEWNTTRPLSGRHPHGSRSRQTGVKQVRKRAIRSSVKREPSGDIHVHTIASRVYAPGETHTTPFSACPHAHS
jgi:hypothetical protein